MKTATTLLLLVITYTGFSQVFGEILSDKRAISKDMEYTIQYSQPGKLIFNIAVDMDGNVTSCVLNKSKSTITATPAMMKAKNKIIANLKFERGYHWPKHHQGYVVIKTTQGGNSSDDDKFAPPPF